MIDVASARHFPLHSLALHPSLPRASLPPLGRRSAAVRQQVARKEGGGEREGGFFPRSLAVTPQLTEETPPTVARLPRSGLENLQPSTLTRITKRKFALVRGRHMRFQKGLNG